MDAARLRAVMAPKVRGAWNLHVATADDPIELFVLFSSLAAVLSSPREANYAAASAFLDALAHARRAAGRPATVVDWGPWGAVGMAAGEATARHLALLGLRPLPAAAALGALERALESGRTQTVVVDADWRRLSQRPAMAPPSGLPSDGDAGRRSAEAVPGSAAAAPEFVVDRLRDEFSRILGIDPREVDEGSTILDFGLDSLTSLELKHSIESTFGVVLPVTLLTDDVTTGRLAAAVVAQLEAANRGGT